MTLRAAHGLDEVMAGRASGQCFPGSILLDIDHDDAVAARSFLTGPMRQALACIVLLGLAAASPQNITVYAADERLLYSPHGAWTKRVDAPSQVDLVQYSTRIRGASVSFSFNGSYIAYISDTDIDHGRCDISLDGQLTATSARSQHPHSHVLLFEQAVDPHVEHTVTITNADDETTALNYFMYSPIDSAEVSSRILLASQQRPAHNTVPPFGLVIGCAMGGTALLLAIIALALVLAPPDPPQLSFLHPNHARARRRLQPGHGDAHLPRQYARAGSSTHRGATPGPSHANLPHKHARAGPSIPRGESSRMAGSSRTPSYLRTLSTSDTGALISEHSHASTARHPALSGSVSNLAASYPNPFASSSRLDLGASHSSLHASSSAESSSHIPLQQQGRLPPGQGFICASCSVELARERTLRQQELRTAGSPYRAAAIVAPRLPRR